MALLLVFSARLVIATTEVIDVVPSKISYHDFKESYTAIGKCKLEKSRTYHARVEGEIDSITTVQGQYVNKGTVILTIDQTVAKAKKSKAEASYLEAKSAYDRDILLLHKKVISKKNIEKSRVALKAAHSELAGVNDIYGDMIITAPFDGYIGVINASIGDEVKKGDYLFSIVANSDKIIFVQLPERLLGKINTTSKVFVQDTDQKQVPGSIIAVSEYLNDTGTVTAKFSFPYSTKIIHGGYTEVTIIFNQHKSLAVPEQAILQDNNGNFVYNISKHKLIKKIYIDTGVRTDTLVEIKSDQLKEGDMVVLEGLTKVSEEAKVNLLKH